MRIATAFFVCIVLLASWGVADGFTLADGSIRKMAVYTFDETADLTIAPGALSWNVTDSSSIRQFVNSIKTARLYNCSAHGSGIVQVVYFQFTDSSHATYIYAPPALYRLGLPGICRLITAEGHELLQSWGQ